MKKPAKRPVSRLSSEIWRLNLIVDGSAILLAVAVVILLDDLNVLPEFAASLTVRLLVGGAIVLIAALTTKETTDRVCASLRRLSEGTQEIEKGNYKVQVENRHPESEVGVLISNFNHMARELDNIEMFRKDFINNFSHEFKTPIASIAGFAARLQRDDLPEEKRREYIDIIIQESRRLTALSSNILSLSNYENQATVTHRETYSLDEQLRQCLLSMQEAWSDKELELELDLQPVSIYANADMLAQVWNNLIGNAIKFTPRGGRLELECRQEQDRVLVAVTDSGVGMDQETVAHIFDKFYQGDSSHKQEGNGLGLSIVRRILELCSGEIQVTSAPQQGSRFQVSLPWTPPQ